MVKVKFISAAQSEISGNPVTPGQLISTYDGRMYWDAPNGIRYELTDIIEVATDLARLSISSPVPARCYWVNDTKKLWRYQAGNWECVNPDYFFIGPDGMIIDSYLHMIDPNNGQLKNSYMQFIDQDTGLIIDNYTNFVDENGNIKNDYLWFIGSDGKITFDSLSTQGPSGNLPGSTPGEGGYPGVPGTPGGVVILDPNGYIPEGYLPIATATKYGIVKFDTQQPTSSSTHQQTTSAKTIFDILGGMVVGLETTAKTIIAAINELVHKKITSPPAQASGQKIMTAPTLEGGVPDLIDRTYFMRSPLPQTPFTKIMFGPDVQGMAPTFMDITEFLRSPTAQTANTQVLLAPSSKGAAPTLRATNTFLTAPAAQTANTQILMAPNVQGGTPTLLPVSEVGGIKVQATAPAGNSNQLWIPTTGNLSSVPHYWNGTAWVPINAVWG